MENILELYVNGGTIAPDTIGKIDLFGDEPINLTISIADIKDISKRNSTFSQNFTVPATKNNNILFNHIFNIGSDATFDPSKKTSCYMMNDYIQIFSGVLQLTKIKVDNMNVLSYDIVVYGDVIDLVKTLGNKLLTDLDFSELNHNRDAVTIQKSWSSVTKDLGYYYPLIDYGYDLDLSEVNNGIFNQRVDDGMVNTADIYHIIDTSKAWITNIYALNQHNVSIISGTGQGQSSNIVANNGNELTVFPAWTIVPDATSNYSINKVISNNPLSSNGGGLKPSIFKPALSNTYLINKIMTNNGFALDSTFIESDVVAETIIPFTGDDINNIAQDINSFIAFSDGNFSSYPNNLSISIDLPLNTKAQDFNNLYNITTHKYTASVAGLQYEFLLKLDYTYNKLTYSTGDRTEDTIIANFYRSSNPAYPFDSIFVTKDVSPQYPGGIPIPNGTALASNQTIIYTSSKITLAAGETVWVKISFDSTPSLYQIFSNKTSFYNKVYTNGVINNYIFFNDYIPKNIKQIDYIKSIINMFNLIIIPSKTKYNGITFIPKDEYFAAGITKNWTKKIDHTENIEETLLSEAQNKEIILTYKSDKDYYNSFYTDTTNKIYGEHKQQLENEWTNGTKTINVIFSPTPVDKVIGSKDIYLPKIFKKDAQNGNYGRTDFIIKFLRKNKTLMPTQDTIKVLGLPLMNYYPYCGHLDHPITSNIDYNFGTIDYAFYKEISAITPNNLFNNYWRQTFNSISDKNSKLIKCKIYLTANDIATFNYNDSIYIEGLTEDGGHYFNVNKIVYSPTSNLPSTVELLKTTFKSTLKKIIPLKPVYGLSPISVLNLGNNLVESPLVVVNGSGNLINEGSSGAIVIGNNNIIANNTPGVVLINANNQYIDTPFVTIVGNTYFYPDGTNTPIYNDIDCGEDAVLAPFGTNAFNDIDCGQDEVLGIGSSSPVQDIDEGEDKIV